MFEGGGVEHDMRPVRGEHEAHLLALLDVGGHQRIAGETAGP